MKSSIVGYSVYVNTQYVETYELLDDAIYQASRFNQSNDVDILPMLGGVQC